MIKSDMQKNFERIATDKTKRLSEIIGVVSILLAIYLAIALFTYNRWDSSIFTYSATPVKNFGGIAGSYLADLVFSLTGFAGCVIPFMLVVYGIRKIISDEKNIIHVFGAFVLVFSLSVFIQLALKSFTLFVDPPGGFFGLAIAGFLQKYISLIGAYIVSIGFIMVSVILISPISIFASMVRKKDVVDKDINVDMERERIIKSAEPDEVTIVARPAARKQRPEKTTLKSEPPAAGGYALPSLDLLHEIADTSGPDKEELNTAASGLEKKLSDFGVKGKIKQAHPGPVVTMYEFEPAAGVKINRIVSLAEDLALSLKAPSIRVYPIAGKATIGLEVPNRQRATVSLKEIIASDNYQNSSSMLTLALGKDIFGNPIVADLAKMPHLLVAGATGSGKSVSINTMIMSLLYKASPNDVKMLMVDPKLLELSSYADIPHLMSPVITNPKDASDALKKVVYEMERRYRLLAEKGTRNIENYNRQAADGERLPYIVVFIDELADLMFTAPNDVETAIARLAQMARASGIHLILATQRPSVDVITGLIKANFPARISFQVTSKIDSRTILDGQGAEQLLGMGDMLFMIPGQKIIRIHGAYISDAEVNDITSFIKSQGTPDYSSFENITIPSEKEGSEDDGGEKDEIYERVIEFGESIGELSISSIQRRFKIGYNRAANYMDMLEQDGLVGPPKGAGKPRDFLGRR
jgi:S-DNA-T family DNA segregation ATPase FtsK/SpoIIIE